MQNTTSTEQSSKAPEAYIARSTNYGMEYNQVDIVKRSATKCTVKHGSTNLEPRVFTLRSDGSWRETGAKAYSYGNPYLTFDVAAVKEYKDKQAARRARNGLARELRDKLSDAGKGEFNGFGDYCGGDEGLARMQAALDILNGVDDVH
jgi:hypothetical protein